MSVPRFAIEVLCRLETELDVQIVRFVLIAIIRDFASVQLSSETCKKNASSVKSDVARSAMRQRHYAMRQPSRSNLMTMHLTCVCTASPVWVLVLGSAKIGRSTERFWGHKLKEVSPEMM